MFPKSLVAALAFAVAFPSAVSAITITAPSADKYWVANATNTITWTYNNGDYTPVSLTVTNGNTDFFNGPFSIAEYVPVSDQSFTVTNVTLKPGQGYILNFVNSSNPSQVYVSSNPFEVKPGGTTPATVETPAVANGTASSTGSSSRTGTSSSSTASATSSQSGALSNMIVSTHAATIAATLLGVVGGVATFVL